MIAIDKGIPVPPHNRTTYPIKYMKVGDSFFVHNTEMRQSVYKQCWEFKKTHAAKFTIKNEKEGFRVWRIA